MAHDWIIDVLADLRTFAKENGLNVLAEQLDDTAVVAMAELASQSGAALALVAGNVETSGADGRTLAGRENA